MSTGQPKKDHVAVGSAVVVTSGQYSGLAGSVIELNGSTQCTVDLDSYGVHKVKLTSVKSVAAGAKSKSESRSKRRRKPQKEEEYAIEAIIEERSRKKRKQYLCSWEDGEAPQWIDAKYLKGTAALEAWKNADEEVPESFEPARVVKEKSDMLAQWLAVAKRPVFLLGAGVSSPVLPTFRGKNGLWTKNAYKAKVANTATAEPTYTHRALVALEKAGYLYFCVTQNYDDLSLKSGFPRSKLSELHGNIFTETCVSCGHVYHRDFEVPHDSATDHETGRTCEESGCGGILKDNIVHFEEPLPWHELKMANAKFAGADLSIVLGSSLQVEPASSMPFKSKRRRHMQEYQGPRAVIVNLQPTPNDNEADLIIRARTDDVMHHITETLAVEVPSS